MKSTDQSPFAQAFAACLAEASGRTVPHNREKWAEANACCEKLYQKLAKKAGFSTTDELDAAKNHLAALAEEGVYEQGFQDCVYLLRRLGVL